VKSLRLLRLANPDGQLTIIDFESEAAPEHPLLTSVARATEARVQARVAADNASAHLGDAIRAAAKDGLPLSQIAQAADTTVPHVTAVINKRRP
jgi:hypothetical protein